MKPSRTKLPFPRKKGDPADLDWILSNCVEAPHDVLPTPCYIWQGCISYDGYPLAAGAGLPERRVHRLSFHLAHHALREGDEVDHLCHNPSCVNPAHLERVTGKENCQRKRNYLGAEPCPKCGSKVEVRKNKRHCVPCRNAGYRRKYERMKSKKKQLTLELR